MYELFKKAGFKSVEDLANAVKTIATFIDDLQYARVFESIWRDSNIFWTEADRLTECAKLFDPTLNETADLAGYLTEACRTDEDQARIFAMVLHMREAYFGVGLLCGARLADPSGLSFNKLADGWMRLALADGRYPATRKQRAKRKVVTRG